MTEQSRRGFVTELRARGWCVLPTPRQVDLDGGAARIGAGWSIAATDLEADDIAARTLRAALDDLPAGGEGAVRLAVRAGAVETGAEQAVDRQAYRLSVAPDAVEIVGNAPPGVFYGVQTLIQLAEGDAPGAAGRVPTGTVTDWPAVALRCVHWDTKHHQDRMQTLKRYIDCSARFKVSGIVMEMEDKFEYPSHPVIGAPGAFTAAQLQELTDYALERHIQLIPNVQSPAHLCYVLKHDAFAHLRCDGSNYQICMDEPEARKLLFEMYDDLIRANQGVEYFHVSTDEVYYAGICEKFRKPYNPENRSLTWVDYVNAAHEFLSKRGRRVLIWLEYPVLAEHVELLPPDIIDGVMGPGKEPELLEAENARGIRQLLYCPIQGAEELFPTYFARVGPDGRLEPGRLADTCRATHPAVLARGNPIGSFAAAWDDSGLHNETFWLGWAAMAQGAWHPGGAAIEETTATFMDLYYGREVEGMVEAYRDLSELGRFWESSWDRRPSKVRGAGYGSSSGKRPITRTDLTLLPPGLPKLPDLHVERSFNERYAAILDEARHRLAQTDRLSARLQANLARARRNRYNLEVLLSLARFVRHFIQMLLTVAQAERTAAAAAEAHAGGEPQRAVELLVTARAAVAGVVSDRRETFRRLVAVWETSQRPRNAPAGGRQFVHVMDDVKDHFADRRADLSYLTAPEESIGLAGWCESLGEVIEQYAREQGATVKGLDAERLED